MALIVMRLFAAVFGFVWFLGSVLQVVLRTLRLKAAGQELGEDGARTAPDKEVTSSAGVSAPAPATEARFGMSDSPMTPKTAVLPNEVVTPTSSRSTHSSLGGSPTLPLPRANVLPENTRYFGGSGITPQSRLVCVPCSAARGVAPLAAKTQPQNTASLLAAPLQQQQGLCVPKSPLTSSSDMNTAVTPVRPSGPVTRSSVSGLSVRSSIPQPKSDLNKPALISPHQATSSSSTVRSGIPTPVAPIRPKPSGVGGGCGAGAAGSTSKPQAARPTRSLAKRQG